MVTRNRIYVCDLPSKYDALEKKYKGVTLPWNGSYLVPLTYVLTPRRPCNYGLTRWPLGLQSL